MARDINRIEPFMKELTNIWKEKCPNWRFGQLIENVLNSFETDPWFMEENEMLERIKKYFNIENK